MKRALFAIGILAAMASVGIAQLPIRLITRPRIPSQDVIDRLGLAFGWHTRVPLESVRDGIFSIQVIPRGTGDQIKSEVVVQTFAGNLSLFDGESGALRWTTPVGVPYVPMQPVAFNSQSIIATRRNQVYFLNRETGIQRVYKKSGGDRIFGIRLESIPSAAPTADEDMVVFTFNDRVTAFLIPDFDKIAVARDKEPEIIAQEREGSIQPIEFWSYYDPTLKANSPAMIGGGQVGLTSPDGRVVSLAAGNSGNRLRYEFRALAGIPGGLGSHGFYGYAGSQDSYLYALNLEKERLVWRFASGGAINRRPNVNDFDVFAVSQGRGMFRLNRLSGESYWLEPDADRFLAAHYSKDAQGKFRRDRQNRILAKFVYAADRHGKLLIIDGDRGGLLGQFDTSDWQVPVVNEWTDRVYFANLDGQVLCLRPRDSRLPQVTRSLPIPFQPGVQAAPAAPAEPKMEEKKAEENMAQN